MSDYRVIATALPHGRYQSGQLHLTVLLNLQHIGTVPTVLSSLQLYKNWTGHLKALLTNSDPSKRTITVQFRGSDASGKPADLVPPLELRVQLSPARLVPDLWRALFPGDVPVSCAKCAAPKNLEFQSYSQGDVSRDLDKKTLEIALGQRPSGRKFLDLSAGDYPEFPREADMEANYEAVTPFEKPQGSEGEKRLKKAALLQAALRAAGTFGDSVARDIARLQRWDPNAVIKPSAHQAVVNINGGVEIDFSSVPNSGTLTKDTPENAAVREEYVKTLLFHRPMPRGPHGKVMHPIPPPDVLDFNQRISILGNHPALLRPLGLAFDLELSMTSAQQTHLEASGTFLKVDIKGLLSGLTSDPPAVPDVHTAYKIVTTGGRRYFLPARKDSAPQDCAGMVELKAGKHELIATEPAAAVIRITQSMGNDQLSEADDVPGQKPHHLRGAGLVLVERKREKEAAKKLASSEQAAADTIFYAEDLLLGYRVDIQRHRFDDGQGSATIDKWRSLCRRTSIYNVLNHDNQPIQTWVPGEADEIFNEGFVQPGFVKQPDGMPTEYQVSGVLFRWDNWSLAAPLPIKEGFVDCDKIDDHKEPAQRMGLDARHTVADHSLPKLEYGDRYRARMRIVDLAGNSHSVDEAPDNRSCVIGDPYIYQRYEPVGIPEVLLAKPFHAKEVPGEQLTHLSIRGKETEGSRDESARFVVPPRVTQPFAEMHGVADSRDPARGAFFDSEFNPNGPYLKMRADGSFIRACDIWRDCPESDCPPQPNQAKQEPDAHNAIYQFTTSQNMTPVNPFFPDPAALFARVLLRGADPGGLTVDKTHYDFYGSGAITKYKTERWPNAIPFGIRMLGAGNSQDQPARMEWLRGSDPDSRRRGDGAGDILGVYVKPSHTAHLLIHCLPSLKDSLSPDGQPMRRVATTFALAQPLSAASSQGGQFQNVFQHWILSSPLVLKLVHAVEKPLSAPLFGGLLASDFRIGETAVTISGEMNCHRRSTGRLEIIARWQEPFDDLNKLDFDPDPVFHRASVFVRSLDASENEAPVQSIPIQQPTAEPVKHDFGDTRYREVGYGLEASSRFKEYYVPGPNDAERFLVRSAADVPQTILNRARPALAVVNRIGPVFRWEPVSDLGKHDMGRQRSSLLRIRIERPWFSSGAKEKLGVVLLPPSVSLNADQLEKAKPFVSQWGVDPLWQSPRIDRPLLLSDFAEYVDYDESLSVEELPFGVNVLAYDVKYEKERHLWYADIKVNPSLSYFPFVRLAFARYQRHSIPEVKLSAITLAEPAQIFPMRTAVATRIRKRSWEVRVTGSSFDLSPMRPKRNEMVFTIVERRKEDKTDTGWVVSRPNGQPISVTRAAEGPAAATVWNAGLTLPERKRGSRYAIMVEETETWYQDELVKDAARRPFGKCETTRLVYSDRLEID